MTPFEQVVLVYLEHQSQLLEVIAFRSASGDPVNRQWILGVREKLRSSIQEIAKEKIE